MQYAYRAFHSTEMALLRIMNEIWAALHEKKMTALILLDLSSAFDTVDHSILFLDLKNNFGINGKALLWIKSYLTGHTQCVNIGGKQSDVKTLKLRVLQGSMLCPLLFTMYTRPLGEIARKHAMDNNN